ncbi:unnamed protein product [Parnassius mnemosyne]|uniref:Peptidase S1 domain-containing protein n=1 Tax=Parnassius mnemosyne TaxID=213953 RepID=A0AAV1KNP5_9NEOP
MHRIQFVCFVVITLMFFKLLKCSGNRHMQPFIVNGKYAKIEKFPHSVYLEMRCWRDYLGAITWELSNCGSSILNQMILLTAAHCLDFCIERGEIVAVAGHENVNKATAIRRVKSILLHENYSDMSFADDIALVFLEESLPLGNTMKRVILTKQNSVGLTAMIAGWGLINDDERREEKTYILRSAPQIVRSNRDCFVPEWRMTGLLCAGSTNINQPRATR